MIWQDIILTIIIIAFAYCLIPQLFYAKRNKRVGISYQTLWITSMGLYITVPCYVTNNMLFGGITSFITASLWLILLLMKMRYKK